MVLNRWFSHQALQVKVNSTRKLTCFTTSLRFNLKGPSNLFCKQSPPFLQSPDCFFLTQSWLKHVTHPLWRESSGKGIVHPKKKNSSFHYPVCLSSFCGTQKISWEASHCFLFIQWKSMGTSVVYFTFSFEKVSKWSQNFNFCVNYLFNTDNILLRIWISTQFIFTEIQIGVTGCLFSYKRAL